MDQLLFRLESALAARYEIVRVIGEGGMARVYLALDLRHGRHVALKVLRPEIGAAVGTDRFLREIRIIAALQHPNILPLFDSGAAPQSGNAPEALWFVMPYVQGESLRARLEREGRLRFDEAVRIGEDVAGALDYAHARGIVHRDVKPENILLSDGHAFVADFGVARAVDLAGPQGATATGIAMGTPAYMSPEQAAGEADLDGRSDVYSLACVFYEMLAGSTPFGGRTPREIMARHAVGQVPPLRTTRPDLPAAVDAALERGLAKEAGDRSSTAMEMIRNLQRTDSAPVPLAAPPARHPRLSRALVFALAAVLAVLAAAVLWQMNRKPQPVNAGISSSAVAVLPFTVRGGDTLGLGEGMVGLLGTKLDGAGDLHSVDSRAVLSYAAREASRTLGPDQGRAIAEHFGAGMFVLGDVLTVGGRLRLTASLYDARAGSRAAASASVEGSSDRVFELVDSLAAQLLKGWSGQEYRLTGIASMTTQSLPALKAFLDGESAFRAGNFDAAVEGFQRAVAQDPQFALAWYRMSIAAEWLTRTDIARDAAEHAMQLADRLSEHDRLLLKALVATRRGAAAEAARLYQNVLATYPNDVEAWLQLGEVQFHYGPLAGHSITEAQATWRRVAALEPRFFAPIVHLTRIAASQGNRTEVDSLVRRALELRVGSEAQEAGSSRSEILELETLRAFALGDTTEQSRLMSRLESATDVTVYLSMWGLGSFLHDPAAATRVGTALTSSSRPPWPRVAGYIAQSNLAAARGHIEAANAMLDSAAILDPRAAAEARATLATYAFRHADRAELEAARNAVERAPDMPEPPAEASVFLSVHHGLHRHLRAYLLGVLDARLGNGARAARYAAELENLQAPLDAGTISRDLAQGVRGEIAAQRERPAEVTEAFAGVRRESWYELASASPYFAQPRERFIQAEALVAQGRDAEATVLYRSLSGEGSSFELPYLAPAQLRLGEIADRQGRADEAAQHYAKVIELWRDADPALQPMVKEARARLAKARGEK